VQVTFIKVFASDVIKEHESTEFEVSPAHFHELEGVFIPVGVRYGGGLK